ncbi:N-acetyl-gamma-glutamyl-phosphate reductase [Megalodesulfovibrio gigas]|uniref:N-acetyl-gamma-glutamyl-phosphate reductase n=1 Tax=Megalodesulfovibrio gigas (strain ATCC 19364 / DSM 1382 / NCIMB 9332 / VKM B-1759) TaxID=1121448 RepID=T2G7N7_MEGG1|nr:N-acetyl-gamma-glutamyl-phosphate reductase [Megalodesulfovibrio gigas]AGW12580.1 putative N-acetyl-gamma-glutamyl-phosphate reductase [Megalodesulfovibrio gigas DSM 1382 = ATCC 19364]
MERIPVGLVGVTGYTGMELARLLEGHPRFELVAATSRTECGKVLQDIYPFLRHCRTGLCPVVEPDPAALAQRCELVFLAVPHGAAQEMAAALRGRGVKVVDLSADFRLRDPEVYREWYNQPHEQQHLLEDAVYGLPEMYGHAIAGASLVANPGCYPTAAILGLWPALANGLVSTQGIVIDAKSGASGAGRKAQTGTLFCEVTDTFRAYNLGRHRHTPEIEQELSAVASTPVVVNFSPHLLPINRGILSTIYTMLTPEGLALGADGLRQAYAGHYAGHAFVRVLPAGMLPETRHVRGTMFCDIAVVPDLRTGRLLIVSVIDNLCRGASGQAVANANLMLGLPLDAGLSLAPAMP